MRLLLCTVVVIAIAVVGGAQNPSTVEVRGVVRDAATGKILRRTSVQIGQLYNSSDIDGRYSIAGITPGKQLLIVSRVDYVLTGIRKPGQGQTPVYRTNGITIDVPSQSPFEMDVYMNLAPQVSGTVVDVEGRPVEGIPVAAYRLLYDASGEPDFVRGGGSSFSSTTDDRGEFLLRSLMPGEYVFRIDNQFTQKPLPVSYYPATLESGKADRVHINAGADVRLRPLVLPNVPLLWVTVKPVDETGQEVSRARVGVHRVGEETSFASSTLSTLLRLPPGSYEIEVGEGRTESNGGVTGLWLGKSARTSIEVRDENVTLPIKLTAEVKTTIRVLHDIAGGLIPVAGIPVRLIPKGFLNSFSPLTGISNPDGIWTPAGIPPGIYRIVMPLTSDVGELPLTTDRPGANAPQNLCVREIRMGSEAISGEEVTLAGTTASVTIILRDSTTRVGGTLGLDGGNATVALVPLDPKRIQSAVATFTDSDGRFEFRCAPPGDYQLYAWRTLPGAAYRNEKFMAAYRDRGTRLRLNEGASLTVETILLQQ